MTDKDPAREALDDLRVGDRVEVRRKGKCLYVGTITRKVDANDEMTFARTADWIITMDLDGVGERRWRDGFFTARTMRGIGCTRLRKLEEPDVKLAPSKAIDDAVCRAHREFYGEEPDNER